MEDDDGMSNIWPDGMLCCEVYSPTVRLKLEGSGGPPQAHLEQELPDIQAQCMVTPRQQMDAWFELQRTVELNLLRGLVERSVEQQLWPTAPVLRWTVYDAHSGRWLGLLWPLCPGK